MELSNTLAEISLRSAIFFSLLSAWVLIGLFQYLNRFTRRRYFTTWTGAWLFYALFLTVCITAPAAPLPALLMAKNWCLATAAVLMLWGSFQLLKLETPERLISATFLFVTLWSYCVAYQFPGETWVIAPAFLLLGLASAFVAYAFYRASKVDGYIGSALLMVGFALWGIFLASYPFLQAPEHFLSMSFTISGVLQLFIATSMIILALQEAHRRLEDERVSSDRLRVTAAGQQRRFQQLFDNATEAILVVAETDLAILDSNRAAQQLFKFPSHNARAPLPTYCAHAGHSHDAPAVWLELLASISECDLTGADGTPVRAEVRGGRVPYGDGFAYQFCFLELTQKARLEQQLRQSEKLSALGQMISGVAHELNNPLAAIKGYTDLLLIGSRLDPATRASLAKVAQESNRAAKLVQKFLACARSEEPELERLDVHQLLRASADAWEIQLTESGATFDMDVPAESASVVGSELQLQQILTNLVTNARQAGARRIQLSSRLLDHSLAISVADDGPGVPPHLVGRTFEPFFTTKPVGDGTGLGLSICHSIAQTHGGRIFYEPSALGGACFTLELPLCETQNAPFRQTTVTPDFQPTLAPAEKSLHVMVVDDESALASLLKEILELLGHRVDVFDRADEALDWIENAKYEIVFSDYRMPVLSGREFYLRAVAFDQSLASRFVFITGDVLEESTHRFFETTRVPYVLKPFQIADIERAIRQITESAGMIAVAA